MTQSILSHSVNNVKVYLENLLKFREALSSRHTKQSVAMVSKEKRAAQEESKVN